MALGFFNQYRATGSTGEPGWRASSVMTHDAGRYRPDAAIWPASRTRTP
jgi:hypothetical protein